MAPLVRDVDAMKLSHHGSDSSTNQALVDRIRPDLTIVSCGPENPYGHPHQEVLDRLTTSDGCAAIWATNPGSANTSPEMIVAGETNVEDGEILLSTDGLSSFTVNGIPYPIVVDATAPAITAGPSAEQVTGDGATIVWATDEPAESIVEYGTTTAHGGVQSSSDLVTAHSIALSGLSPETTYHYRVGSIDGSGNGPTWSGDATFTTSAAPGLIVINEVASYGSGADEWVDIYNAGLAAVDMTGWALTDNDTHTFVFPAFTLPAGAYVLVTSDSAVGADDPDASDGLATFNAGISGRFGTTSVWNNAGDDVQLKDAAGQTVDWMAYGSGTGIDPGPAGAWTNDVANPGDPTSVAQSVARWPNGLDLDLASDWRGPGAQTSGFSNGGEPPAPPVAEAGHAVAGDEGTAVQFDGSASAAAAGATIVSFAWTFGDGTSGSGAAPAHVYADNGSYDVTLTVTDSNGLASVDGTTAEIANVAPAANAAGPCSGEAGVEIAFAGSAIDPGTADQATLEFTWDFGDGSPAEAGASVSHAYAAAGTYVVTLFVSDKDGATGTSEATVTVSEPPPPPPEVAHPLVVSARNNATGKEFGPASAVVAGLDTPGDGGLVAVAPGADAWWEARFGAVGGVGSVESAAATVFYRMVKGNWNGTLTLELRSGGALLGVRELPESAALATVVWDVTSLVTPQNVDGLSLRLVNVDPKRVKVNWGGAALSVTYR